MLQGQIVSCFIHISIDVVCAFLLATEAHDDDGLPHTLEHLIFMGSEKYPYKVCKHASSFVTIVTIKPFFSFMPELLFSSRNTSFFNLFLLNKNFFCFMFLSRCSILFLYVCYERECLTYLPIGVWHKVRMHGQTPTIRVTP